MIWQYNPKKHQVWVPDAKLTIPCIKSMKTAKSIMVDDFDPTQWQCVVVSKSGTQLHNHPDRHSAELDALERCTKTAAFVVYENGKAVSAFINKKQLPEYKRVMYINLYKELKVAEYKSSKHYTDPYKHIRFTPQFKYAAATVEKDPWEITVDRTDDRVRVRRRYVARLLTKSNKRVSKYEDLSLTIHKNGRVFIYKHGKISRTLKEFYAPIAVGEKLIDILDEFKPGIKMFMPKLEWFEWSTTTNIMDIAMEYSKPNFNHITDSYQNTIEARNISQMYYIRKYFPSEITDESKLVPMVAKKAKVPLGKQFKKLYLNSLGNVQLVKNVVDCGFKDPNNIINIAHLAWTIQLDKEREYTKTFISYLISEKTESWVTRAIIKEGSKSIRDAARMAQHADKETLAFIVKESTNLNQIHETLVRFTTRNANKQINREIPYTDEERDTLTREYGNITFSLPKDTRELATIGYYMGICVGSYGNSAIRKDCTIVQMKEDDHYVACIELRRNRMVQLKAKYNNPVDAKYKSVLDKWLDEAELEINTLDYDFIGRPANSRHNYACLNPYDFEEHNDNKLEIVQVGPGEFEDDDDFLCWIGEDKQRVSHKQSRRDDPDDEPFVVEREARNEVERERAEDEYEDIDPNRAFELLEQNAPVPVNAGFTAIDTDELPF